MTNEEIYEDINSEGGLRKSSDVGVIPRDPNTPWKLESLERLIKANPEFNFISISNTTKETHENGYEDIVLSFNLIVEYEEKQYSTELSIMPTENLDFTMYGFVNMVDQDSINAALESPYMLYSSMYFIGDPTEDFLVQLKILHTFIPEAAIGLDTSSLRAFSPYWLKMTAESSIAPTPEYLYSLHSVYDEKEKGKEYWLHTHGLHRCGAIELEMLIKDNPQEMYNLIKHAAHLMLYTPFKENEVFKAGYDGMGINLSWTRWEDALQKFEPDVLGGINDRIDEEGNTNVHSEPSGILFAVEDNEQTSPEIYGPTLKDNPIFFISTTETNRMSALAKERLHHLKSIFDEKKIPKKSLLKKIFSKSDASEWTFLVKLGLTVDNADNPENDKEHLWFEVSAIDSENRITGKLINQPYWIASLNEGDIKTFPAAEVLTDWTIYGPEAQYTPDTIYAYYHS